jgi:hypothetical protein
MDKVFGVVFVVVGALLFFFAPWTADQRASAHYSATQLESTDPATRARVKRFKVAAIVLNMVVGAAIAVLAGVSLFR